MPNFTRQTVETILRLSEGAVGRVPFGGRPVTGHTGERHSAITNAGLAAREHDDAVNGGIALFLAFLDFRQTVDIATATLNHPRLDAVLEALRCGKQGDAGTGRLNIERFDLEAAYPVRMNGRQTVKTSYFTLRLQKDVGFPSSLMVVTFFPTMLIGHQSPWRAPA